MAHHSRFTDLHKTDPRHRVSAHYHQQHPQPMVFSAPGPSKGHPPRRHLDHSSPGKPNQTPGRVLLAGGSMLALAALVITPSLNQTAKLSGTGVKDVCIKQIDKQSLISRDELKAVLDLSHQVPKAKVQEIVEKPHCVFEARSGVNGVQLEREAYPLEFDPQTWFVLLYQDGKYVGFDFSFR